MQSLFLMLKQTMNAMRGSYSRVALCAAAAIMIPTLLLAAWPPGQLAGWGTTSISYVPPGTTFRAVAAGPDYCVAVTTTGLVAAWGNNDGLKSAVPAGLSAVRTAVAGVYFGLGVLSNGTVQAWGSAPTMPAGVTNIVAVAAKGHVLALRDDGTVIAWGDDSTGAATVPVGLTDVKAVAAGGG
jgi:hypothetical protein